MSVTFHLYQPRLDLEFLGCGWMKYSNPQWKHLCEYWRMNPDKSPDNKWLFGGTWNDGQEHYYLNLTEERRNLLLYRSGKRQLKHLEKAGCKHFKNEHCEFDYLTVDEIAYGQGWFLKQRFFNLDCTLVYRSSLLGMMSFFHRYVNLKDRGGKEVYDDFIKKWKDGLLFCCDF